MLLLKVVIVASITFIAASIPSLVEVIIVVNMIVAIDIPILIVLIFLIIVISLLLRLRCFTFASFPPAINAVIDVVEIFIGEFVNAAKTDLLQHINMSKLSYFMISLTLTATSSAMLNDCKL